MSNPRPAHTLRIIAGTLRGARLSVPVAAGLRPTPDRVRESVFAWLGDRVVGARVLDLFCGSGALALEALSRGASAAVMVEQNEAVCATLSATIERLGCTQAQVVNREALGYLRECNQTFDLVFLDPPFAASLWCQALTLLRVRALIHEHSLIYLETPAGHHPAVAGYEVVREGQAGADCFALWRLSLLLSVP
ncbi:MAG: 16S rRNA (guanine(966)-N(2))-methyltransferase RsmD [Succinivibrio sp.]|nr:16S rRNA (guanine(966)-N(2))-methyltransferase RsmD [Succinivibrio sp.]